jgi:hypothetical protein
MKELAKQLTAKLSNDLHIRVTDSSLGNKVVNFSAPLSRRLTKEDVEAVRSALTDLGYAETKSWSATRAGVFSVSITISKI